MKYIPMALLFCANLPGFAAVIAVPAGPDATVTPSPVAFERFDYTGNDEIFSRPPAAGAFQNPILAGFYPDPSICRVGDDYYLINSTFSYFPGIPIFHSRDLVNWTQIGHVIHRPDQLSYAGRGVSEGIFAPAISYHEGIYYVVCTMVGAGGNFVVTATNPAGPWSDPVWLKFGGIDPSLFFDDDGRAYLVGNDGPAEKPRYEGHRAIWLQEFDLKTLQVTGPRHLVVNGGVDLTKKPIWIEGPHVYKHDGAYFLCAAEGGTGPGHSQVIFRSQHVAGPYLPAEQNPILTQRTVSANHPEAVTNTGHADLVQGPDGNWWAVFLGSRPYAGEFYATGRETFLLPVSWPKDGWPLILPAGQRVPLQPAAPVAKAASPAPVLFTGNFTWSDSFDSVELSPLWIMLRAPSSRWWDLTTRKGTLLLAPRAESLSGNQNPSYLARRLQHRRYDASTTLEVPSSSGVSAGLAAFQAETHHYFLAVRRTATAVEVFVERRAGGAPAVVARTELPTDTRSVSLKISGDDAVVRFSYATQPDAWTVILPDADATILTTQKAGGFVGATLGLHARLDSSAP